MSLNSQITKFSDNNRIVLGMQVPMRAIEKNFCKYLCTYHTSDRER